MKKAHCVISQKKNALRDSREKESHCAWWDWGTGRAEHAREPRADRDHPLGVRPAQHDPGRAAGRDPGAAGAGGGAFPAGVCAAFEAAESDSETALKLSETTDLT